MSRAIGNIIRKTTRKPSDKLNCLYGPSGIEYEKCLLNLLSDRVNFYSLPADGQYVPIVGLDFDFILSQSRIHQLGQIKQLSRKLHLPIVSIEHGFLPPNTPVNPDWVSDGLINVYSNVMARNSWGDFNAKVVPETVMEEEKEVTKEKLVVYETVSDIMAEVQILPSIIGNDYLWSISTNEVDRATFYLQTTTDYQHFQKILTCLKNGTIVIAKDCPIIREFIIDGVTGFLYNNPQDLTKIKDIDIVKLQTRIKKSYYKFFSKELFKETYTSIFDQVNNFYRG